MRFKKNNTYNTSEQICRSCFGKMWQVSHRDKERKLRQLFYYNKWYVCECGWVLNKEEDKVYNSKEFKEYENIMKELPSLPLF